MKRLLVSAFLTTLTLAQAAGPRTVYILPMAGGLDQHLAQWLTRDHVMQVVADPKTADVVLTDRLGEAFEQKMTQIHPRDDDDEAGAVARNTFRSSKGRGTIFLVDTKSRQVLWSDYEKAPRGNSDRNLNRQAQRIAKKLQQTPAPRP